MAVSLYNQIRSAERLVTRLIHRVKATRRCSYNPQGSQCDYPSKRGFIYCPLHLKEILQDGFKLKDFKIK
jgi:hypothetical protein